MSNATSLRATIFDIQRNSVVDGPGIRTTVFFKGCNLRCAWCHNPESQSGAKQLMVYQNKCRGCGTCKKVCPHGLDACELCGACALFCPYEARELCGKTLTVDDVVRELVRDASFYRTSGGGATFSGGECMLQIDFLEAVLAACAEQGIHTAVDTAGCVPYSSFARILPYADLVLYDVKCIDPETHERYTGVSNDLILQNLKRLLESKTPVWIRVPIVGGVNDTVEEMRKIKAFLERCGEPERVELLPYHAMGEHKYRALGSEPLPFAAPSAEKMEALNAVFA